MTHDELIRYLKTTSKRPKSSVAVRPLVLGIMIYVLLIVMTQVARLP